MSVNNEQDFKSLSKNSPKKQFNCSQNYKGKKDKHELIQKKLAGCCCMCNSTTRFANNPANLRGKCSKTSGFKTSRYYKHWCQKYSENLK